MPDDEFDITMPDDDETDNSVIRTLRAKANQADKLQKQLDRTMKELQEREVKLAAFEMQQREAEARRLIAEVGLPEGVGKLFVKTHEGEVTHESVQAWAAEHGLAPQPKQDEEPPAEKPKLAGFEPVAAGGQTAPSRMSALDAIQKYRDNPAGLVDAWAAGLIEGEAQRHA